MDSKKIVFITGAGSGIGLAIGEGFSREGARVFISDSNEEKVMAVADLYRKSGMDITGVRCDVTSEKEVTGTIDALIEKWGRIDVLINNAGLQYISPLEDFPTEQFELLIKVMLTAPFIATKRVFPAMKKQKYGRIINMASINGLVGFAGKAAYNSAKHGVIGLTKAAALEGAEFGITVNAVCPGYVDTPLVRNQLSALAETRNIPVNSVLEQVIFPLVPQKRLLTVQEITDYVLFLASDKAGGITGQAVVIDGGYTAQ